MTFGIELTQKQVLPLIFTSYITLGKLLNLSKPSLVSSFVIGSGSSDGILKILQGFKEILLRSGTVIAQQWHLLLLLL